MTITHLTDHQRLGTVALTGAGIGPDEIEELRTALADLRRNERDGLIVQAEPGALHGSHAPPGTALGDWLRATVHPVLRDLHAAAAPVVIAAQGRVSGLGLALCLRADVAVAAEAASFGLGRADNGDWFCGAPLHRLAGLGRRAAAELAVHGREVDAARAVDLGLVTEVAPTSELPAALQRVATRLNALPPGSGSLLARSLRQAAHLPFDTALRYDSHLVDALLAGED
ncbi:enoyl-CoA hydratase-related protein [Salinactinospora qingdaonensis]|uniref:Enoyl-CoA hydratase/carnithine racemase n=1 Tax=Salinactinospora qingdaonensis TaxID=702744 RepID=A0ABP7F540_9ACTN